jgi:hypothetical protein
MLHEAEPLGALIRRADNDLYERRNHRKRRQS